MQEEEEWQPFVGVFPYDLAFEQNPDVPVFYVSDEERERVWLPPVLRPRPELPRGAASGSFTAVI